MAQNPQIEVQAQEILNGLDDLAKLLDEPLTRDALDLAEKTGRARTRANYDLLSRLRRSLRQYLSRDGDLFYVGLLGHFSSGKSSTINSVLELRGTEDERPTDLNPTDTTITLVTRPENLKSLLGVIKEGQVIIRSQGVDNPLLSSIVLADTPGTGDPVLIEEIARDFLPICDVLLFFFSAASPLDDTDIPLLMELHKRLSFIPVKFIVTRADEFRFKSLEPLSSENMDKPKLARFFEGILMRINKTLHHVYTEEDFILIDNRQDYNTGSVIELLKSRCNPANPHARVLMHGNKLRYFLSTGRELRNFFSDFLDAKLQELQKILTTADQNIQRYNQNVRISNSNLTLRWHEQLGIIRAARERALERVSVPEPPPRSISDFPLVTRRRAEIETEISAEVERVWRNITSTLKLDVPAKRASGYLQLICGNLTRPTAWKTPPLQSSCLDRSTSIRVPFPQ